jgi:hypothetical protein
MKLEAPLSNKYVKFTTIGDTVRGLFVRYEENIAGTFGPENNLTLKIKDGSEAVINCKSDLARKIGANVDKIVGRVLEITYVSDLKIVGRPQPMKIFDVDVSDPKGGVKAAPAPAAKTEVADADDLQF